MTPLDSIPIAPGRLPLLGHLVPLLRDPLAFLQSLPQHGDLVRVQLGPATAVVVCDPTLTDQVLRDDRTFDKGGPVLDRLREILGNDGLATCPHSSHRRLRRLAQPAFRPARLTSYARTMTSQISDMTDSWGDGQVLDVPAETMTMSSKTAVETMFGDTLPPVILQQALTDAQTVLSGGFILAVLPPALARLPLPANRRYHQALARLRQTIGTIITGRHPDTDRGDLLAALLAAHDPEANDGGRGLTDSELTDQVITFFFGGAETVAATLAWSMHLLAEHPDVQEQVHTEAQAVLNGVPASLEHLPQLDLTKRVITETLRLRGPGWMLTRIVTADSNLGNHPIPAGTTIVYSPYLIHHRRDLYPDPHHFDPDRWNSKHHPQPSRTAFIPFGGGARKCIGDQFGINEAVLSLATIVARWRLEPVPGRRVKPRGRITLKPHGLRLRITTRTQDETGTTTPPPTFRQQQGAGKSGGSGCEPASTISDRGMTSQNMRSSDPIPCPMYCYL